MSIPINTIWSHPLLDPSKQRQDKPRTTGITMVIDKGLGLHECQDLCHNASSYIDFIKLGFGTMALYPQDVLERKITLFQKYGMNPYAGGTFFEIALHQHAIADYVKALQQLSITTVELSDGTIELSMKDRKKWIKTFISEGFNVITEYGKKLSGSHIDVNELFNTVEADLEAGSRFVIVEGRESGTDVGLYDANGDADKELLLHILQHPSAKKLVWEAPQKQQQVDLIQNVGFDVNFGNIAPHDVYGTEALRRGLRSDTFSLLL